MSKIAIPVLSADPANYVNALAAFGAEPEVIHTAEIRVEDYAGLLIPGGTDVNPARYGRDNTASRDIDPELDELQFRVLDLFVKAGKPVLGVCRGMQVINVYFGGILNQDIDTKELHYGELLVTHNEGNKIIDRVHGSRAIPGSWVYELYGEEFPVNSFHHQVVEELGKGLKLTQVSEDGLVEGYIHEELPVYGIQWHPERCGLAKARPDTVDGSLIYKYFVEQCERA